jgi:Mg-chelatase subunit ChlI
MALEGLRDQERLKLKAAHRFLFCVDEVNVLNEKLVLY